MVSVFRRNALPVGAALVLSALWTTPSRAQVAVSSTVAAANKAQLVQKVQEFHGTDIWPSKLIGTVSFKLSDAA